MQNHLQPQAGILAKACNLQACASLASVLLPSIHLTTELLGRHDCHTVAMQGHFAAWQPDSAALLST